MALILTLISIVLCYFSPAEVAPKLAPYHLQYFIVIPALVTSITVFSTRPGGLQFPQAALMIGFWFAVVASLLSRGWLRASLNGFIGFGITVCIYFLVSINAFSLPRIKNFCRVIIACAVFMSLQAIVAYHTGYLADKLLIERATLGVITDKRVCGYGVLHDPNDFAQFLLVALAFLGLAWKGENFLRDLGLVSLPGAILIYAIYLTASRGAIFGLAAIALVVVWRWIGFGKALAAAGVIVGVLVLAHFGGGRSLSIYEGSAGGRVVAWGSGIADLKSDPLFGVGFGQFTEYNDLTAHNSFVLCFAELGFFGYFFWLALLVTTVLGLETLARAPVNGPEDVEFRRYVTTIRAALYCFLVTSCFLSRTYQETLYILLALGAVLIYMRRPTFPELSIPMLRWVPLTVAIQLTSVAAIYAVIRFRNL